MFQVKATIVGFDADEEKHPCHFRYQIGEEIIYDGERIIGRVCPSIFRPLAERINILHASGDRHLEGEIPGSYYPFFHSPFSVYDPSYKKYGYSNISPGSQLWC